MSAASRVSNNAATSSTFMHTSGIVMEGGKRRQLGSSFARGFAMQI